MTTADMSLVAKESILVEKLKKNMQSHFFCPILSRSVTCVCRMTEKNGSGRVQFYALM